MFAAPAYAGPLSEERFAAITEEVFGPIVREFAIPGIAIGVSLNGERHYFTEGVASRAPAVAVDTDTLFELGSVSKLFNVTLAALADRQGILSLDENVADVMPALRGSAFERITLYDLAAHANGGLPLQVPNVITSDSQLTDWLADWTPAADPKTVRSYSNISIGLLGRIVGQYYGGAYEIALNDRLLPELGLESTYISVPGEAMRHYAFGYSRSDDRAVRVNPGILSAEAYGVKSSISDMVRFLDAHLGNVAISPDLASALRKTREARYDTEHYAQAMIWEEYRWPVTPDQLEAGNGGEMITKPHPLTARNGPLNGPVFLNKTGSTKGFGAYVAMVPDENIGVVVLANRNYPNIVRAVTTLTLINRLLAEASK
ncbi:MAG: serine hydrolase [Rhizobiaceae bacterium]